MGFDVEGEDLQDMGVVKRNCEVWEIVEMNWTV